MKSLGSIFLAVSALTLSHSALADASDYNSKWVSLYSGNEVNFNSADRERVLAVLKAFGISHEVSSNKEIMISPSNRGSAQDLISKVIYKVAPKKSTHSAHNTEAPASEGSY